MNIVTQEKDKVTVRRNHKTGKYEIVEVVIHGDNIGALLAKAYEFIKSPDTPPTSANICPGEHKVKYKCEKCGIAVTNAFDNMPPTQLLPCPRCKLWTNHTKISI
jgi:DNA-directed RNA polymerase subunit RPC12/RpoP